MIAIRQAIAYTWLLFCIPVMTRPHLRPFEYRPQRIDGGPSSYVESQDRSLTKSPNSPGVEEAAISILIKVKIFPFRKTKEGLNRTLDTDTARFGGPKTGVGELAGDNGVFGAGVDFGLPDGSGFGYGEDMPFKTISLSRVSFFFK